MKKWFGSLFQDDYISKGYERFQEEQKKIQETERENETLRKRVRELELRLVQIENYLHQMNERYVDEEIRDS